MTTNLHFIKACCHQSSREQGFQFAPDEIKEKYDYEIKTKLFSGSKIDSINGHSICKGYELLYKYILKYTEENPHCKIITIGGDNSISAATVAAMNEKYMVQIGQQFDSKLKVLWLDSFPDLETYLTSQTKNLNDMPVASLFGICDPTFAPNKLLLKPSQIVYVGLSDDIDISSVSELGIEFYTTKKIKQIGLDNFLEIVSNIFNDSPTHVVIDLKVFDKEFVGSVDPVNKSGLNEKEVMSILNCIKKNIIAMDITEFNPYIGTNDDVRQTREIVRKCLVEAFDLKEKSLNIFNENSKFLIYRPTLPESPEDYGWNILTGIPLEIRQKLMEGVDDDSIITIDIDDREYLVAKTSVEEQNKKSYYRTTKISDTVLFPNEKISMVFELINPVDIEI